MCSLQIKVCNVQHTVCRLSSVKYAVPELPAGVGVQGLLVEVGVDLAGHLNPLQQLPPQLVVLGQDLAVVGDHGDPALGRVVADLDRPDELPHLQVVGEVLPVLGLVLEPVGLCLRLNMFS